MGIIGIAPGRHSAQSAFRPAMVGIRPLLGSFHWSAFGHLETQRYIIPSRHHDYGQLNLGGLLGNWCLVITRMRRFAREQLRRGAKLRGSEKEADFRPQRFPGWNLSKVESWWAWYSPGVQVVQV